jgi:hypothetical protein
MNSMRAWVVMAGAAALTLVWDPNSETNLAGYKVYWGAAPREYPNVANVGNVTNYTATNLAHSRIYYFAATAYNTNGVESDFSEEVMAATPGIRLLTNTVQRASSPGGPWTNVAMQVVEIPDGESIFLRGKLDWGPKL